MIKITQLTTLLAVAFATQAQIIYTYNPDGNADGSIGADDLLSLLQVYTQPFSPAEPAVQGCLHSGWALPMETNAGLPAVFLLNQPLPEGYVYAEHQECAASEIQSDSYCVDTEWDDICLNNYNGCIAEGGCTMPLSAYLSTLSTNVNLQENLLLEHDALLLELMADYSELMLAYTALQQAFLNLHPNAFWSCGAPYLYQGYSYSTVQIGDQCWFAENLRSSDYENGDVIAANLSDSDWQNTTSGAVAIYGEGSSTCPNFSPDGDACDEAWSLNEYGRLYNWYAVEDARGLCPSGWHVPTDGEWMTMEMALGMSEAMANSTYHRGTDQGTQMKTDYGWSNGGNGTNSSGFSGLPGGYRYFFGGFNDAGSFGYWWSSSPNGISSWFRDLDYDYESVYRSSLSPRYGFSVRCVRDAE